MVLRGETTAATDGLRPPAPANGGDERYRAYDGEVRTGRSWWPWLLALGRRARARRSAGSSLYDNAQRPASTRASRSPSTTTRASSRAKAVELILEDGFEERVRRLPNARSPRGTCIEQEPAAGTRAARRAASSRSSSRRARPKVTVPSLVGKTRDDAVTELTALDLEANVVEVNSEQPSRGSSPPRIPRRAPCSSPARRCASTSRRGPKPVAVPNVVGLQVDIATSQLQLGRVHRARPVDVESEQPAGEVVAQDRHRGTRPPRGDRTITLSVSKGPTTVDGARRDALSRSPTRARR